VKATYTDLGKPCKCRGLAWLFFLANLPQHYDNDMAMRDMKSLGVCQRQT